MSGSAPSRVRVGVAQWRLDPDPFKAVLKVRGMPLDCIQVDLGGGSRGPRCDSLRELVQLERAVEESGIAVDAVTVNLLNDIGGIGMDSRSRGSTEAFDLCKAALSVAVRLRARILMLPLFRKNEITDGATLRRSGEFLTRVSGELVDGLSLVVEAALDFQGSSQLLDLAGEGCELMLDTGNHFDAGVPLKPILTRMAGRLARSAHLKNSATRPASLHPLEADGDRAFGLILDAWSAGAEIDTLILENDYRTNNLIRMADDLKWTAGQIALI